MKRRGIHPAPETLRCKAIVFPVQCPYHIKATPVTARFCGRHSAMYEAGKHVVTVTERKPARVEV
jgi:hypothetical protein